MAGAGWGYGTDPDELRDLVGYWADEFDWPAQEARIGAFNHLRAAVDGFGVHLIHERGVGPNPLPLLLLHG